MKLIFNNRNTENNIGIFSSLIYKEKLIQIDIFILNFYSLFLKRKRLNLQTKVITFYQFKIITNTI